MTDTALANTTSQLAGKTLITAEGDWSIPGLHTFSRGSAVPFAVGSGALVVTNLDADKVDGFHGTEFLQLVGGTVSGVVIFSGKPSINAGLQFPATQAASTDVNTFDDYEEGAWTPVIGGSGGTSGQTYSHQVGKYIKKGKEVWVTFSVLLTAKGTITTSVQIQGLPFTSENITNQNVTCPIQWDVLNTTWVSVVGFLSPNSTAIGIIGTTVAAAANSTALTTADITNTTRLVGTFSYSATT